MPDTLWYDSTNDLDAVKSILKLNSATDDDTINKFGIQANRKIDNLLFPHKDKIPEISNNITDDLKTAAIYDIIRNYKIIQNSLESSEQHKKLFYETINEVINRLKAIPEGREDTIVYSNKYRSEPLRTRQRYFGD